MMSLLYNLIDYLSKYDMFHTLIFNFRYINSRGINYFFQKFLNKCLRKVVNKNFEVCFFIMGKGHCFKIHFLEKIFNLFNKKKVYKKNIKYNLILSYSLELYLTSIWSIFSILLRISGVFLMISLIIYFSLFIFFEDYLIYNLINEIHLQIYIYFFFKIIIIFFILHVILTIIHVNMLYLSFL